ncbi:zinc-ribbon domain-containing protein [Microbacterium sp. NPDC089696]|uniref:zinc-ribbon domain-containing protein n=1 Tax=Microbacterium sp. NPDC089696 TaxID=3364199 RepID=UPI00381F7545
MLTELRKLPMRVRPIAFETVESYAARLRDANFIERTTWSLWFNPLVRLHGGDEKDAKARLLAVLGDRSIEHHQRDARAALLHTDGESCNKCETGLSTRYGCRRCSGGSVVTQVTHDGPRVCHRHRLWVGPGTEPEAQEVVGKEIVAADRHYQVLRRRGILDAHRLAELLDCVDEWAATELDAPVSVPERFLIAIELARRVMAPRRLATAMAADQTATERYVALSHLIGRIVRGRNATVLVDAVWLMLRTMRHAASTDPHAFLVPNGLAPLDDEAHLAQLRSSGYPRSRHLYLVQYVSSAFPGTRASRLGIRGSVNTYLCARGHLFRSTGHGIRQSTTTAGCPYCANRAAAAGFNSLVDTHPEIAKEWHPDNDITPDRAIAGSDRMRYWLCAKGHKFRATVTARTSNRNGCGVCANRVVQADVNSLAVTRPDLAAEWHRRLNGDLTPEQVPAGTDRKVWWRCPEGHDYLMSVNNRSRKKRASSCSICSRQQVHPSTCLATTHKAVAQRWHGSKNGDLRPTDVVAGSTKKVWWQCARGHEYEAVVWYQTRRQDDGCNVCTNRAVNADNSMRTTHAALSSEFDENRNGEKTPDNVLATTKTKLWWKCQLGHEWQASGVSRVQGAGCPFCSGRRVLKGWNDLATTHRELANEWHESRNEGLRPEDVVVRSSKAIWWQCAKGHEWQATPGARRNGNRCPVCSNQKVLAGFNDLMTTHPDLGAELASDLNGSVTAQTITAGAAKKLWWRCTAGHEWTAPAFSRVRTGSMCPTCRRELRRRGKSH